ncbi:MAG: hypothetical protein A2836_00110 [Candidatus Taylorbacteria bacterium RIFCSPHIGHO2_01_FULL_45_63]|uniref:Uncharacterized protein n=1 Tax=Candidatus Taylorbacteria bacterium RIFCSPHIGHO2_02_FULL_45_35 TaxID=1802311 RepID=A0A1G2MTL1_9BACT|nr:MAG: hypothetical protein A2836_00110 [Candidatus Taylorbacteria bacterium RIFCSPHIGHO2_01_FULL_45_63]OHA27197.1 MAG: hypothetical protein A3D56_01945 [Candidatus Taylorbacteria bacterium RIFCSPHIGHO2_02_FULL_45_35]OHA33691.1 MAG: hypothetical protein A3A22_03880 [Candidatus Taylorbacteria bacterium RIFCSPLOWO2_01_FULL_45_34b]
MPKKASGCACSGGRHTTVCEVGERFLKVVNGITEIKKVVPSIITNGYKGRARVMLQPILSGFRVIVKGCGKIQEFFIYVHTELREVVQKKIYAAWVA